jgi:hypothetical protein
MRSHTLPKLLAVAAAAAASLTFAHATSVTTDPVGFQKKAVPVGLSDLGLALNNSDLHKGLATGVAGSAVTMAGVANVGALLTAGDPYYIEVYGGDLKGDRFDVDTAATIAAANGTVVLNGASPENTFVVASIGTKLDNVTVALRKHHTLEGVQAMFSTALVGNNLPGSADQIWLLAPTGAFVQYFLRGDNVTWRQVGLTVTANKTVIAPGTGVMLRKTGAASEVVNLGNVRVNDFARPLKTGLQLVAPPYPVAYSPSSLGATAANGWTGNNLPGSADQLWTFNSATGAFVQYFLRGDGVTWRQVGLTTDVSASQLFGSSSAFMVSRKTDDASYVLVPTF